MSTSGVKLFVGNLPQSVKNSDLKNLFEKYGPVSEASIVDDYGFVHMKDRNDALAAISGLKSTVWYSSILRVEFSTNRVRLRDDLGKQKSFRNVENRDRDKKNRDKNENESVELSIELEEGETLDDIDKSDDTPATKSRLRSRSRSPLESNPRRRVEIRNRVYPPTTRRYNPRTDRNWANYPSHPPPLPPHRARRPSPPPRNVRRVEYDDRKYNDHYRQPFHANAYFDSNNRHVPYNGHHSSYAPPPPTAHAYYNSVPPQRSFERSYHHNHQLPYHHRKPAPPSRRIASTSRYNEYSEYY